MRWCLDKSVREDLAESLGRSHQSLCNITNLVRQADRIRTFINQSFAGARPLKSIPYRAEVSWSATLQDEPRDPTCYVRARLQRLPEIFPENIPFQKY